MAVLLLHLHIQKKKRFTSEHPQTQTRVCDYPQSQLPLWKLGAAEAVENGVSDLCGLVTQQEILRQVRVAAPLRSPLLQQDPSVYALSYALEEECLAMLNPLENQPLVLKVPEEVGQLFIRGVKGQLRQRRDEVGRALVVEEAFGDVAQHGKGGVEALGLSSQRQQRRERRRISGGEREGASQPFLWDRRWGLIREKPDLVSGGTWERHSQHGRAKKRTRIIYYVFIDILNGDF